MDPTFHSTVDWGYAYHTLELPDHKLLLAGLFRVQGGDDTLHLIRLLPNGELDPTFNNHLQSGYYQYPDLEEWRGIYLLDPGHLIITGAFNAIDGHPRGGIALVDTAGNLLDDLFDGSGCGPYYDDFLDHTASELRLVVPTPGGSYYYVYGAYNGYNDGTTNDPEQRFISRLYGLNVGVQEQAHPEAAILRLYPDPATTQATLDYDLQAAPQQASAVVSDIAGRERLRITLRETRGQAVLDMRQLPPGTYTVQLLNGGSRLSAGKLIVQP